MGRIDHLERVDDPNPLPVGRELYYLNGSVMLEDAQRFGKGFGHSEARVFCLCGFPAAVSQLRMARSKALPRSRDSSSPDCAARARDF